MIAADMRSSSDFAEVVALEEADGHECLFVHRDIITKTSLFFQRHVNIQTVRRGRDASPYTLLLESVEEFKPYITWCYTGSVSDNVTERNAAGNCPLAFEEYKRGTWLLDAQYANAILDKLMEQEFDAKTLISHCREMFRLGLQGSKLWQWYVKHLAAKMASKDLVQGCGREEARDGEEGLPRVLLEDVLLKVIQCRETAEFLAAPTAADREKYHMSEETVEGFWVVWLKTQGLNSSGLREHV